MSKFYAQLENDICVGVQQALGELQAANLIEIADYDERYLGQTYDGQNWLDVPVVVAPIRNITKRAFYARLSMSEKIAIEQSDDPVVKVINKELSFSSFVDLDSPDLASGLDYLVSVNILTAARKDELLTNGTNTEQP